MRITEVDNPVTQTQIDALERALDKVFAQIGIDVEFTRHFLDRANDERNVRQITLGELGQLFKKEFIKWGKPIARLGPDAEAVMKDLATDINIPFALNWNKGSGMLELVAKTVMRKKNFSTPNQEFPVESYTLGEKQLKKINESFIVEAGPAVLAVPVGVGAMELLALGMGFAGIAAMQQAYKNNPSSFPDLAGGAIEMYNKGEAMIKDMMKGSDVTNDQRLAASEKYQQDLKDTVLQNFASSHASEFDVTGVQEYLNSIAKSDEVSASQAAMLAVAPAVIQTFDQLELPELGKSAEVALSKITPIATPQDGPGALTAPAYDYAPAVGGSAEPITVSKTSPVMPSTVDRPSNIDITSPSSITNPTITKRPAALPVPNTVDGPSNIARTPAEPLDVKIDMPSLDAPGTNTSDAPITIPKSSDNKATVIRKTGTLVPPDIKTQPVIGTNGGVDLSIAAALAKIASTAKATTTGTFKNNNDATKKTKKLRGGDTTDSEYDNGLQKWVKKWTPRTFESAQGVITEGGNVFKTEQGALTQRIATKDIQVSIDFIEKITGLTFDEEDWLGTTGKKNDPDGEFEKNSSGDLDLNTDANKVSKEQLIAKLSAWLKSQGVDDADIMNVGRKKTDGWIKDAGDQVHFRTPIAGNGKNGFVQTDFMFTDNPDFQRGAKRGGTAQFGGTDRAILLSAIARGRGLKFSPKFGLVDPNNGDQVVTNDWSKGIPELLLGKGAKEADTHTVESMLAFLKKDPNYEQLIAPWKETMEKAGKTLPEATFRSLPTQK